MKQDNPEEFPRTEPVVIRGDSEGDSYWGIEFADCELVSRGKEAATTAPVPARGVFSGQDFAAALRAWKGKEVSVSGYYCGDDHLHTSYGRGRCGSICWTDRAAI
jgi:hypothetical protein